ncbi:DUF5723 family protein [Carboxylicivirga taeanensis]|uniref:DUF5723 family protein n=1 Tax=Carboxylicivirga taeanensis TaxID=1416875 RepID=UPI003F6DC968
MKKLLASWLVAILFIIAGKVEAQNAIIGFMNQVPQSQNSNPANFEGQDSYVSLPVLSSVDVSLGTKGFSIDELIESSKKANDNESFWGILEKTVAKDNEVLVSTSLPLLGIGIKRPKGFWSLNLSNRSVGAVTFSDELMNLRFLEMDYNTPEAIDVDVENLGVEAIVFNEYRLGYARELTPRFKLGLAVKFLVGHAYLQTNNVNMQINYDELQGGTVRMQGAGLLHGPFNYVRSEDNSWDVDYNSPGLNYFAFNKNTGVAFDLGFRWKLWDKLILSGAIVDVGSLNFRENGVSFEINNEALVDAQMASEGVEVVDLVSDELLDELIINEEEVEHRFSLPAAYHLQVEGMPYKWLRLGAQIGRFSNSLQSYTNHTLTLGLLPGPRVGVYGAYSFSEYRGQSLDVGMYGRLLGFLQLYTVVGGLVNKHSNSEFSVSTIRFGINILI